MYSVVYRVHGLPHENGKEFAEDVDNDFYCLCHDFLFAIFEHVLQLQHKLKLKGTPKL